MVATDGPGSVAIQQPNRRPWRVGILVAVSVAASLWAMPAAPAQGARLGGFLDRLAPAQMVPGADRFGPVEGTPPAAAVYKDGKVAGYVFLNSDVVNSVGYSGKPIDIVIALDRDAVITGAALVEHHEPIVLVGIPEKRVADLIAGYVGRTVADLASEAGRKMRAVDIISGATVTVLVVHDSIARAAVRIARSRGLGGMAAVAAAAPARDRKTIDMGRTGTADWLTLLGDGSVRRLRLSVGEINAAYERSGPRAAAERPERGDPGDVFIDLHVALASVPVIGRSLLGEAEYALLRERLEPDQQAVLIAANGRYSFKGSGYVRGGIFDRIQIIQGENSIRFRDRDHKRIGAFAGDAPKFKEIGLFTIPAGAEFDPTRPWRLELLVQRAIGPLEKAFLSFDLAYAVPERYLKRAAPPAPAAAAAARAGAAEIVDDGEEPLWQRIWRQRVVDSVILTFAIGVVTVIFFFQNWLAQRPRLVNWIRIGFLVFTTVWIGFYAQAQLSVVNVLTFTNALLTEFRWDYFLIDPMLFILWSSVAASILFWGRGAYCGWLCPFGALQELLNKLARWARVPQLTLPWGLHERLWPIKYMIFLLLFGLSFYSLGLAERVAEVEPFKTAIILRFAREWPFVLYAVALLAAGLFIERFFCRYLCPLGAALAIPGRMRMFEWLRRHKECGLSCQRCANDCMVQAIQPDGRINPNECLYCLNCQLLYFNEYQCPAMVQRRLTRERRQALRTERAAQGSIGARPAARQPAAATGEGAERSEGGGPAVMGAAAGDRPDSN